MSLKAGSGNPTFADFANDLLQTTFAETLRPKTYQHYTWLLTRYLIPAVGHLHLSDITTEQLNALIAAVRRAGLSTSTTSHVRRLARRVFNLAQKRGLVERNPAEATEPIRREKRRTQVLTVRQIKRVLAALRGHGAYGPVLLAAHLGLRIGEACGLKWEDVDFGRRTVTISRSLQRLPDGLYSSPLKTVAAERTLPLPRMVARRLELMSRDVEWCFPSSVLTPQEPRNVLHAFQDALKRAGLPRVRFHDLRHSCATLLIAEGVPLSIVQGILGHSSIQVTADVYGHLESEHLRGAADAIDRVFRGDRGCA